MTDNRFLISFVAYSGSICVYWSRSCYLFFYPLDKFSKSKIFITKVFIVCFPFGIFMFSDCMDKEATKKQSRLVW